MLKASKSNNPSALPEKENIMSKLRTFGKFNDHNTPLLILGEGLRKAIIFAPYVDQGMPEKGDNPRCKDGFARKHYPVKFYGTAKRGAPCSQLGLYGTAAEVVKVVKNHLSKSRPN